MCGFLYDYVSLSLYILHVIYFNLQRRNVFQVCKYLCVNIFVFMLVAILNPRVEDMLYLLGNFLFILQVGVGYALFSLHTPLHIMSGALYPGL